MECRHLENLDDDDNKVIKTHIKDLLTYCIKHRQYMAFYKMHILKDQVDLILLKFLFTGQVTKAYEYYSQMHGDCGIQLYAINSMLYLRMIKDKYIEMCNEFISQLHNYVEAIRILAEGYLPISLITPLK